MKIRYVLWIAAAATSCALAQNNTLLPTPVFHAIRDAASGEEPLIDFRNIVNRYTGFTPSKGEDDVAEYIAQRLIGNHLTDVKIEGFPADGKKFYWAFIGEPAWEAEAGVLDMVQPRGIRLADFAVDRQVLGRYSTSADITSEIIDVGNGTQDSDYEGKNVKGKLVLASGNAEAAHRLAVWKYGAAGLIIAAGDDGKGGGVSLGNHTGGPAYIPWSGPNGEPPGFLMSIRPSSGAEIRQMLHHGEPVVLHALVKTTLGAGEYKQVTATVQGSDPSLPEVWVKGHDNYRNGGGGNNLTGVGAVIEVARVLTKLVNEGTIPRPKRTIRFLWSAEHFGDIMMMHEHPELAGRVLAFSSVDMVGFNQEKAHAVPRLALLPHSLPHFYGDVAEDFFRSVAEANIEQERMPFSDPKSDSTFAPTGTRAEMRYTVEQFWGPSDHEDMDEALIAIPSVEYGHPLHYSSPGEDNAAGVDPTQMRRMVTIIAATADYMASADAKDVPRLAAFVAGKAQDRMAKEARRALETLAAGSDLQVQYREALNIVQQSHERELKTVDTLRQLGESAESRAAIVRARKQIDAVYAADQETFEETAAHVAAERNRTLKEPKPTEQELRLTSILVKRNESMRGPINLFRPEYGGIWLAERTGDVNFAQKLKIASMGRFTAFEALNFVDGKRNLLEVRDLVSAEYGPMPPEVLEEYFDFLEHVGVVTITKASARVDAIETARRRGH